MQTEQMKQILEKIKEYNRIIIFRHKRPDGDAVGSTKGLREILRISFPEKEIYLCNTDYSDYVAFLGGEDGGDFYRALTPLYRDVIADEGFIAYEIGYDQADALRALACEAGLVAEVYRDYGGNDRVVLIRT